jgi:CubicO group peptidase (beta-lactamase class C family)
LADLQSAVERLEAAIARKIERINHLGLAIGVSNRERLLFLGNYGFADRENGQPVKPDTLFQIGSISKAFTSIVLLQLQEGGLLSIDDPVTHHLPWFEINSEYAPITLRHLMSHTAGIIMGADAAPSAYTETWDLRHTRASTPPGEMFHYSNSGYKVLGLIAQRVLKQNLADILSKQVLAPLGMVNTEPVITNNIRSQLAVGYEAYLDDRPLPTGGKLSPAPWFETATADGSISSTAADMCRYIHTLLNRGKGLLTSESFEQLIQPVIPTGDDLHGEHYGLGLSVRQIDGHQVVGHGGGMVGYTADLLADLHEGLGVVVLTNGPGEPSDISQFALDLVRAAVLGQVLPDDPFGDPYQVADHEDYVGQYTSNNKMFKLTSSKEGLVLTYKGESTLLEPRRSGDFIVPHPEFELFSLRFGREAEAEEGENPQIVEAFHGPDWYCHTRYRGKTSFQNPPEWQAFVGHYRSYNPWLTNFRVVIRKDCLVLIHPWGGEESLHPTGQAAFRVGNAPRSPEFLIFDMLIDDQAMRANLSGGDYCRIFTP